MVEALMFAFALLGFLLILYLSVSVVLACCFSIISGVCDAISDFIQYIQGEHNADNR